MNVLQENYNLCAGFNTNQTEKQLISQTGTLIRKQVSEMSWFSVDEMKPCMHIGTCVEAHVVLSCLF